MESMTGFGSAQKGNLRIEAKSINHRFLEINFRMPYWFYPSEMKMRDLVRERFSRGKFDIIISFVDPPQNFKLNYELIKALKEELRILSEQISPQQLSSSPISIVINLRDLMTEIPLSYDEGLLLKCLSDALDSLKLMRQKEGEALKIDIMERIEKISSINDKIKTLSSKIYEQNLRKLRERILNCLKGCISGESNSPGDTELFQSNMRTLNNGSSEVLSLPSVADKITSEDIIKTLILYLERFDITEEIERIESHITQFKNTVALAVPKGKKLDFLLQELLREFNTISSKSNSAEVRNLVVEAKTELEKLREQIQNIE
jgi:uncharacterized protein YicC (UPF0701 family)